MIELKRQHGIAPEDVTAITINTFHEATRLNTRRPIDGDAAQYSLPLVVAVALVDGDVLPDHVLPEYYDRDDIWRLVDCVGFTEDESYNAAFPGERYADVTITLKDGQQLRSSKFSARGNYDNPLSDKEILTKLGTYGGERFGEAACARIASLLTSPDENPTFSELARFLQPETT